MTESRVRCPTGHSPARRCLALDVGERRTGIALGERIARPLTTLKRRSKAEDFDAIARLIDEHQVDTLVVGLPLNMDGSTGYQAQRVVRYAERMATALAEMGLNIELAFWDERLTTEEAGRVLDAGRRGRRPGDVRPDNGRADIDAIAAAVILQSYLDRD